MCDCSKCLHNKVCKFVEAFKQLRVELPDKKEYDGINIFTIKKYCCYYLEDEPKIKAVPGRPLSNEDIEKLVDEYRKYNPYRLDDITTTTGTDTSPCKNCIYKNTPGDQCTFCQHNPWKITYKYTNGVK